MSETPIMRTVPLRVTLSLEDSAHSNLGAATVHVTVTNLSPHPVSILRWSSPLDPRAIAMGTLKFVSSRTNETAPCLNIKINRKMPASGYFSMGDDQITTIPAGGTAQRDLQAKEPEVALTKGEQYLVKARGRWMGVWIHESEEKEAPKLRMEDALTGDFESNRIGIEIPAGGEL
ncbi:hypothetical protein LSUE1_G004956 [Lachnellula suecica]|uniref:Uncharacterized protein n=1 Tax=Lachnellula suecica TaxID=602035 RepID=A0A8T9C8I6_9HELO|nr:hypothetical protein LSUE1_G004956 [Lachnellula suecica]